MEFTHDENAPLISQAISVIKINNEIHLYMD